MTTWNPRANEVFLKALELRVPGARQEYLDGACAGDAALRAEVEGLLDAGARAGNFLESPAPPPLLATLVEPPVTERPGTVIGPYKLLEQIGEGGFGVVFLAEQQQPVRRKVALKVLKPGMDTRQVVARFEAERQALALMDHPHIARVLDGGQTTSGRPYFVMDLVKGLPITDYCDQAKLRPRERLELFVALCQAVQHAHQKGIIHRDLKPSNVLVTMHDSKPAVKVIDFGIAKALGQELTDKTLFTGFAQMIGTPLYMSPEQAGQSGLDIDTRSDIYSLGVLLYELLTGTTPFERERLKGLGYDELRRMIREEEPPRPSTRISTLGQAALTLSEQRRTDPGRLCQLCRGELDWIVMKALDKDRSRRYETAGAFLADVQRYLNDEPVQACPPSALYRLRTFARRHRAALVAVALVGLAVLLGAVASTWFGVQALAAAGEADRQAAEAKAAAAREAEEKEQAWQNLYLARLQLAQAAWRSGNVARLRELLEETRPRPGQRDLRGPEWYYLWRLCHSAGTTFRASPSRIRQIAFSPDGKRLASVSIDRLDPSEFKVWDPRTARELLSLSEKPGSIARAIAFSPDGRLLARCEGNPRTVELWDAITGRWVRTLKCSERACDLAFSPDGKRLAIASAGPAPFGDVRAVGTAQVRICDVASGQILRTLAGHKGYFYTLAFSPDGKWLAAGGDDALVKIWDTGTGREALVLKNQGRLVLGVAFSPDSKRLAATSREDVRVWDVKTGEELLCMRGHAGTVNTVAFSPDGKRLASGSSDQMIKMWDAATGRLAFTLRGHTGSVYSVAFSPDGKQLVSGDDDGMVKLWDATTNPEALVLEGSLSIAFSPDSKRLACGGPDRTILIRDVSSGRELLRLKGIAGSLAFSPDGKRLASSGGVYAVEQKVTVWDTASGKQIFSRKADDFLPRRVRFSPDGTLLAASGEGIGDGHQRILLWKMATGRQVRTIQGETNQGWWTAFSPAGHRLACADGGKVKVWEVATGRAVLALGMRGGTATAVAFSPNGRRLAAGKCGSRNEVTIWDLATAREVLSLRGDTDPIFFVAFSPDGKRLASSTGVYWEGERRATFVRLWDTSTGQEVLTLDAGLTGTRDLAFSPDGRGLACVDGEGVVRIWDMTVSSAPMPGARNK
jgi:WD40 repeat protein/serine/threonine protein kinase